MDINEFDYNLPENLIAQTPIQNRSESKLLVMDRKTGALEDKIFKDITSYFHKGDVLVLNDNHNNTYLKTNYKYHHQNTLLKHY